MSQHPQIFSHHTICGSVPLSWCTHISKCGLRCFQNLPWFQIHEPLQPSPHVTCWLHIDAGCFIYAVCLHECTFHIRAEQFPAHVRCQDVDQHPALSRKRWRVCLQLLLQNISMLEALDDHSRICLFAFLSLLPSLQKPGWNNFTFSGLALFNCLPS